MKPLYGKVLVDGVTVGAPNYIKAGMIGEITYYQINQNTYVKFPLEKSGQTSWCFATNQVEIISSECPIVGEKMMELEIKNALLESENKILKAKLQRIKEEIG